MDVKQSLSKKCVSHFQRTEKAKHDNIKSASSTILFKSWNNNDFQENKWQARQQIGEGWRSQEEGGKP